MASRSILCSCLKKQIQLQARNKYQFAFLVHSVCKQFEKKQFIRSCSFSNSNFHLSYFKRESLVVQTNSLTRSSSTLTCRKSTESTHLANLITMKIESPEFKTLFTPEMVLLIDVFKEYGYELRIAGGAVRDLLAGKVPADVDFATTATPQQMKAMFNEKQIRMINENGESHGTISVLINDKEIFEITTLRIDVVTDGRRAQVEFTTDWKLDANRRDLTINSMFLDMDGTVCDFFNGIQDLQERRVRFVGDAAHRIQEDYLRILRYFRFFGRISNSYNHEQSTLNAIKENAQGMSKISGERIWMEMKKILSGNMTNSIVETMMLCDLGPYMGLPDTIDFNELNKVYEATKSQVVNPVTRLVALMNTDKDLYSFQKRNKISNDELALGLFLIKHRRDEMGADVMKYCIDLHFDTSGKDDKAIVKVTELMKYRGELKIATDFPTIEHPVFPIKGEDIIEATFPGLSQSMAASTLGPRFSAVLFELRRIYKESNYTSSKEELVGKTKTILDSLPPVIKKSKKEKKKSTC